MRGFWVALVLVVIAVLLQCAPNQAEGFVPIDGPRCGVNLPPCEFGYQCMNGYCGKATPPRLPEKSDLPIFPSA